MCINITNSHIHPPATTLTLLLHSLKTQPALPDIMAEAMMTQHIHVNPHLSP